MPHLQVEAARGSIERQLLTIPIEFDAAGAPADILAPPVAILRTIPTALSTVRVQIIVRTVSLQAAVGSAQCALVLTFNEGSLEVLSAGESESLLAGTISIPFFLAFFDVPGQTGRVAQLSADFTNTVVNFSFDAASNTRLTAKFGTALTNLATTAIQAALTAQFQSIGTRPTGLNFTLTAGVASEDLMTVDRLPGVAWIDPDTLALWLTYAAEPLPPPFLPTPFLPPGNPSAFGLRLRNDGFQRTVRNPAVRAIARDMLSDRLIDGFVQNVFAERGGQGDPTDQDRAEARKRLADYLQTPQGLKDLAGETPGPTGNGRLRKRIKKVPDPFSDFDVEIPELDLWLGQDRIEGRAVATGEVNGFGFRASTNFRATPVLVTDPKLAIEMHDIEIDDPDISISLPVWLEWATGILVALLGGGAFLGAVVGFLLSSIVSEVAEAFVPSNLGSKVPPPDAKPVTGLPPGVTLTKLSVIPEHLEIRGRWSIFIDDPRPFYPRVQILDTVERSPAGIPTEGRASFVCLGVLGVLMDAKPGTGTAFTYLGRSWQSKVTLEITSTAVPLPLTRFPWTIQVGYRSPAQYHFPVSYSTVQTLAPGTLTFNSDVWLPTPPLTGTVENRTFNMDVSFAAEKFTLFVPPESACIILFLSTKVVDGTGVSWDLSSQVDVLNQTVTFGSDFSDFGKECASHRKEFRRFKEPSLLDKVWNPPDVFAKVIEEAIRTEQPSVTDAIGELLEVRGRDAFNLILAPSKIQGPGQ